MDGDPKGGHNPEDTNADEIESNTPLGQCENWLTAQYSNNLLSCIMDRNNPLRYAIFSVYSYKQNNKNPNSTGTNIVDRIVAYYSNLCRTLQIASNGGHIEQSETSMGEEIIAEQIIEQSYYKAVMDTANCLLASIHAPKDGDSIDREGHKTESNLIIENILEEMDTIVYVIGSIEDKIERRYNVSLVN